MAHNVEAAKTLERNLAASGFAPEVIAVCGMLRDKDIAGVLRELAPRITRWHLASLPGPRAAAPASSPRSSPPSAWRSASIHEHASPAQAFAAARESAGENDKLVVFGSFLDRRRSESMAERQQDIETLKRRGRRRLVGAVALCSPR